MTDAEHAAPTTAPAEAAPPAPPEAPATPAPAVEKPPAARDWTALRAQEQRVRKQAEEAKAAQKEANEARAYREEIERLAKESPEEALKRLGLSYDDLTKRRLNGGRKDPVEAARDAARAETERMLREQQEAAQKAQSEAQERASAEHWQTVTNTFSEHVKAQSADLELVASVLARDPEAVYADLRRMAEANPRATIEQAARDLEAQLEAELKQLMGLKKFQALMAPPASPEAPKTDTTTQSQTGRDVAHGARTLTNTHAQERASGVSQPKTGSRHKSERDDHEELIRRALARVS
jgi:hypothetical protein